MDSFKEIIFFVKDNPATGISIGLLFSYCVYYFFAAVQHPKIYTKPRLRRFLVDHCSTLREKFWPAFWCIETRAHTVISAILKSAPHIAFEREVLTCPDGGCVALDWVAAPLQGKDTEHTQPTVILMPGITGSSGEGYVRHLTRQALNLGLRVVVFMNRGLGGVPLLTPRTYFAGSTDDLRHVISHVKAKYPDAPLFGTGVSLGGVIILNYLAETGKDSQFFGAMTFCPAFDIDGSSQSLEKPLNKYFNRYLLSQLASNIHKHKEVFEDSIEMEKVMKSRTIREYDEALTAKVFGFSNHMDLYREANVQGKLRNIAVPVLCLNAADDCFSPAHLLPVEEAENAENFALVVTKHGGHIGFMESTMRPWDENFMDRLYYQWLYAMLHHRQELLNDVN